MADIRLLAQWCGTYAAEIDAFGETTEGKRLREIQAILIQLQHRIERPREEAAWIKNHLLTLMRKKCVCNVLTTHTSVRECHRCIQLREGHKHFAAEYERAAHINAQMGPRE